MTQWCWCANYMGPFPNVVHVQGSPADEGNCVHFTPSASGHGNLAVDLLPVAMRLVRLLEELLERDDHFPDADLRWYRERLNTIKEELRAEERRPEANRAIGAGAAGAAAAGSRTTDGRPFPGD